MWNLLLYAFISFLITNFLHRRGRFRAVRKVENAILTALGVILPFVDIIVTWVGYEHEGNPLVILLIDLLAEGGWVIFVLLHVVASFFVAFLSQRAKSEEEIRVRAALFFIVVYLIILTVMNALLLWLYGVF